MIELRRIAMNGSGLTLFEKGTGWGLFNIDSVAISYSGGGIK